MTIPVRSHKVIIDFHSNVVGKGRSNVSLLSAVDCEVGTIYEVHDAILLKEAGILLAVSLNLMWGRGGGGRLN